MDPLHRQWLESEANRLTPLLNLKKLLPFLKSKQIFTQMMLDDIYASESDEENKSMLLHELQTRGPRAFQAFKEALELSEHDAVASLMVSHDPSAKQALERFHYVIPQNIPSVEPVKNISVLPATEWKINKKYYKMTSGPRGLCLLINNRIFKNEEYNRYGSEHDVERLRTIFQQLGYRVYKYLDLTAKEMTDKLLSFSCLFQQEENKHVDSCIVIIMSHGKEGVVFGIDEVPLETSEIFSWFNNVKCEALIGKPKIFFIQACRGHDVDIGVESFNVPDSLGRSISSLKDRDFYKLPTTTDMAICNSTIEGYVSIRNKTTGSWYCEALVQTLAEMAKDSDLQQILACVDDKVRNKISEDGSKQATETTYKGFSKTFYFNPGLYTKAK